MAYLAPTADFVTSTLNGALTAVATSATIGTGLNLPATNGILQIDYDSVIAVGSDNGPETISYTSYTSGTGALAGITRGLAGTTGVAHLNGANIQCGPSSLYLGSQGTKIEAIYNPYRFSAYRNAAFTTTGGGTVDLIVMDTEEFDTNNNFSTATGRYTVPVTGYYQINGAVNLASNSTRMLVAIYVDGVDKKRGTDLVGNASITSGVVSALIYLTAGQIVDLRMYTDAATAMSVGSTLTYINGHLITT